ncbi:MAG: hypothetical protein ACRDHW_07750 [Ktedonobacteraceae bacterium]
MALMETRGQQLRAVFIDHHGYRPEESFTPYIPVTIDGPQDHDEYHTREYPPD